MLGFQVLDDVQKGVGSNFQIGSDPFSGNCEVSAWWVAKNGYADDVEYQITYGAGSTDTVYKSHKTNGGQWNVLGQYNQIPYGPITVQVNAADGKTAADAVQIVCLGDPVIFVYESTNFIHTDHLGTPRQVTDLGQTVVWRWNSRPFGDSAPNDDPDGDSNTFTLNLRFPGQYYDQESGLHYNYFRDYDASTGRYIESDPIGLNGGVNTFGYALSNPTRHVDPSGQWANVAVWGAFRFFGGRAAGAAIGRYATARLGPTAGVVVTCVLTGYCSSDNSEIDDALNDADAPPYPGIENLARDCKPIGERIVEPARNPRFKGGISIEQEYTCNDCESVTRHTIVMDGKIVHDHFRPGRPKGDGGID